MDCFKKELEDDKIFLWSSGLDAFQAEKVMETLQKLAQDGHTVICSIHQPRGSVYAKFDDIVLLTEGTLVYAGPAGKEPLTYFGNFGLFFLAFTLIYHMSPFKCLGKTR